MSSDFAGVGRDVLRALLGADPTRLLYDEDRGKIEQTLSSKLPREPERWPEDLQADDATFLLRALARRLAEGGGTVAAAKAIRLELQAGDIPVAALSNDGTFHDIDRTRWRGEGSRNLFWNAREGRGSVPNLYVRPAPAQPEPNPDWWPGEKESLKSWCAQDRSADRSARERLKMRGQPSPSESAICAELSHMWREAGRTGGPPGSIETARSRMR